MSKIKQIEVKINEIKKTMITIENSLTQTKNPQNNLIKQYIAKVSLLNKQYEEQINCIEIQLQTHKNLYAQTITNMTQFQIDVSLKEKKFLSQTATINELNFKLQNQLVKLKQKDTIIEKNSTQLSTIKKELIQMKLENKTLKTDNKILMQHIDKQSKSNVKQNKERQLRTMRSTYKVQNTPFNELKNKVALQSIAVSYEQLTQFAKKISDENQRMQQQHRLLFEDIELKNKLFQGQKQINELQKSNSEKLNEVIKKMSDKIHSLEQINRLLKQSTQQENQNNKSTKKVGELYSTRK